jgi:NUMOD3 motif
MIFYTYLWLREDGTPYYVGKGVKDRAWHSGEGHRPPKDKARILIQEFPSEQDAMSAEVFLIAYYGRKDLGTGCLRNLTDGGEGSSGLSVENRAKKADAQRGKKYSVESREKMAVAKRGKKWSSESRAKLSAANLGRKHSPEARARMSKAQQGRTFSVEARARMSEAHLGKTLSEEQRQKIAASNRGKAQSSEAKAKIRAAHLGLHPSLETRVRMSEGQRRRQAREKEN